MLSILSLLWKFTGSAFTNIMACPTWVKVLLLMALSVWGTSMYTEYVTTKRVTAVYAKALNEQRDHFQKLIDETNEGHERAAKEQARQSAVVIADLNTKIIAAKAQKQKTITIVKEVSKYVTQNADAQCVIPVGFVWLHNTSLTGEDAIVPGSEPGDADAPTAVKLSEVSATVGNNYAECVERGEVIKRWQEWYPRQKKIFEDGQAAIAEAMKKAAAKPEPATP